MAKWRLLGGKLLAGDGSSRCNNRFYLVVDLWNWCWSFGFVSPGLGLDLAFRWLYTEYDGRFRN